MDPRRGRIVLGIAILIAMTVAGVLFGLWAGEQLPGPEADTDGDPYSQPSAPTRAPGGR